MREGLHSLVKPKHVGVVEGHHVSVSAQNYHGFLVQQGGVTVARTRLFADYVALTLVKDNFRQIETLLVAPWLLSHARKTEDQGL